MAGCQINGRLWYELYCNTPLSWLWKFVKHTPSGDSLMRGPRFTANDGRDLCEVIRVVAMHSICFQRSGLEFPDCEKYLKVTVPAPTQLKATP